MSKGFGGGQAFNRASPSSHGRCVQKIVADYLGGLPGTPRVLDVGGTSFGFSGHPEAAGCQIVIANPEQGVGAHYSFVSEIPPTEEGFDLALLFGVIMYLDTTILKKTLADIRQRLRPHGTSGGGTGFGTLLVAEPDPDTAVLGPLHVFLNSAYGKVKSLWSPTEFHFYSKQEATALLHGAGFNTVTDRSDLAPHKMGVIPPPLPPYYVLAARI